MTNFEILDKNKEISVITLDKDVLFLVGNTNDGFVRTNEIMGVIENNVISNIVILSEYELPVDVPGYLMYNDTLKCLEHVRESEDVAIYYDEEISADYNMNEDDENEEGEDEE